MRKNTSAILGFALCLCLFMSSCSSEKPVEIDRVATETILTSEPALSNTSESAKQAETAEITIDPIRNLEKLCKVWGFTKYTHKAFISGKKDWDAELTALIPLVKNAGEEQVNQILYDWFISLGDSGYGERTEYIYVAAQISNTASNDDWDEINALKQRINNSTWIFIENIDMTGVITYKLKIEKDQWDHAKSLAKDYGWLHYLEILDDDEAGIHRMANTSWIEDEDYLGENLSAALSDFTEIKIKRSLRAPVTFDSTGRCNFSNEKFVVMKYDDENIRLHGLFRLWNAMEYYFPYLDIIDYDWHEVLTEYIPIFMEGTDRLSYEEALLTLTSRLSDGHIFITEDVRISKFGRMIAPVMLQEVEGQIVVIKPFIRYRENSPFLPGDIILKVNGRDAHEIAYDMLQYKPYPNEEKALKYLLSNRTVLVQKEVNKLMEVDIIRDGSQMKVFSEVYDGESIAYYPTAANLILHEGLKAYEILDNNIGVITPSCLPTTSDYIHEMMKKLQDTDGLIIDMRTYPNPTPQVTSNISLYFSREISEYVKVSGVSGTIPGVFAEFSFKQVTGGGSEYYDKKVVILINEETYSRGEYTTMALRNGDNVTVMGTNSIGIDGDVAHFPLVGGYDMRFSGLGIYTAEGGQTQRIGLVPDIYVYKTIEGVKEGRDELMEAAIKHIFE